jgi:hypothetical protein
LKSFKVFSLIVDLISPEFFSVITSKQNDNKEMHVDLIKRLTCQIFLFTYHLDQQFGTDIFLQSLQYTHLVSILINDIGIVKIADLSQMLCFGAELDLLSLIFTVESLANKEQSIIENCVNKDVIEPIKLINNILIYLQYIIECSKNSMCEEVLFLIDFVISVSRIVCFILENYCWRSKLGLVIFILFFLFLFKLIYRIVLSS